MPRKRKPAEPSSFGPIISSFLNTDLFGETPTRTATEPIRTDPMSWAFEEPQLPQDVRGLLVTFADECQEIRDRADREKAAIQTRADEELAGVARQLEENIQRRIRDMLGVLGPMQNTYAAQGKLDEAIAIRDQIRQLRSEAFEVRHDPGSLRFIPEDVGRTVYYQITGTDQGTAYGTDTYTTDCSLAVAAVHAGVVKIGETAIVCVTMLEKHPRFQGSTRNGVTSLDWDYRYPAFRVHRAR